MNKVRLYPNMVEVLCERGDTETLQSLQAFYPVHHNRNNTRFGISARLFPEVMAELRPNIDISSLPINVQQAVDNEYARRAVLDNLRAAGPLGSGKVNGHLTLAPHQQMAREIAKYYDRFGFFYDTRTGKTPMSLTIINDSISQDPAAKWLIVCPLILIDNAWLEDAAVFFPNMKIINCHAATKAKREAAMKQTAQVYITNTESFATYKEYFDKMNFTGCFVDESSSMKSPSAKQTKALVEFAHSIKRFYLLSGTPAPNGEYEYYSQLQALDAYCVPQSYTQFKQHYFIDTAWNSNFEKLQLRVDMKDELYAILHKYSMYVDKEDVLVTPGRTFNEVVLDMPESLKAHYNSMKNDLYVELLKETDNNESEVRKLLAKSAAAKCNKLNQLTSGIIIDTQAAKENRFYNENAKEWYLLEDYRFQALYKLLDEHPDDQVLIWANYRAEFEIIKRQLGDDCKCIYGATSLAEKTAAIKDFKAGRIKYLVANPASADKGLTLTNAHIAVYFSLNWSYELYKQSIERIYGSIEKQPKHCEYYIFIAKGSIDAILYRDVLQGKASASASVLSHLKPEVLLK